MTCATAARACKAASYCILSSGLEKAVRLICIGEELSVECAYTQETVALKSFLTFEPCIAYKRCGIGQCLLVSRILGEARQTERSEETGEGGEAGRWNEDLEARSMHLMKRTICQAFAVCSARLLIESRKVWMRTLFCIQLTHAVQ